MPRSKRTGYIAGTLFVLFVTAAFWVGGAPVAAQEGEAGGEKEQEASSLTEKFDAFIGEINGVLAGALFWDVAFGAVNIGEEDKNGKPIVDENGKQKMRNVAIPFVVAVLALGGIFFSFWYRWISIRGFKHCIDVIRGKYDRPEDKGEISHFRALTSALSATVGLGNIAGVAIAIQQGGPGAVFWMWLTAVFGMATKFSSCTLSQLYRQGNPDGSISGGPMYYLDIGLKQRGLGPLGKALGILFALMVMGGALGGGNMFQANQSFEAFSRVFNIDAGANWIFGLILATMVGVVILGGIKRIGLATSRIVPAMCGIYVVASLFIISVNIEKVPETFGLIFGMAFTKNAFLGGMVGVLIIGVTRAAFSNEAGLGSAAIAHAAAKTDEPVREGIVAMIGPFIDTIVVCTMTALVVVITGTWDNPEVGVGGGNAGVELTVEAFKSGISWFPYVLAVCIVLFAYSTMISWCYYGERGWIYLLDHFGGRGLKTVFIFRIFFVVCVFIGSVASLGSILDFSDLMILCMAFPNIVGSIILAPVVLQKLKDYWGRYQSGQMKPVR